MTTLSLTINGRKHGPIEVRDDLSMNDFLREMLGMTGTKSRLWRRAVPELRDHRRQARRHQLHQPDLHRLRPRTSTASRSAPSRATPKDGQLSALQKAFIEHFAFQCGYCTAGFLNEGQVLLERLARTPVPREPSWRQTIADALDGHLCRCTGYIKYHEAVRDVILADAKRYLTATK